MKKANAFVVLLVLIPIIFLTQCKSKEYPPDYKTTTPTPITDTEGNNEDPFLLRAKDGTIYLVWFSERSGNADIYMKTSKDGKIWSEHIAITRNSYTDTIPEIFSNLDQSEFFVAWCSPNGTWDLPFSDLKAAPKRLLGSNPGGYSPRVLPLTDKDYLVVWTGKNKKGKQIYSYQIKKPYGCKKEEPVSAQEWSQIRSEDIAQTEPGWSTPIYIESNAVSTNKVSCF